MPRSSSVKPIAFTKRKPPLLWRMAAAIVFATSSRSRRQVDVVGDERHARADDRWRRRSGGARRPEVGRPLRRSPSSRPALRTRRAGCPRGSCRAGLRRRLLVQIDGHAEAVARSRAPTFRASATQSAIVTPSSGTNGTTSTAPMRGCSPRCVRRSMSATARSNSASTARSTPAASPASVNTDGCATRRTNGRAGARRRPRGSRPPSPPRSRAGGLR